MSHPTCCCSVSLDRCDRCDLLVGLEGFHLMSVARTGVDEHVWHHQDRRRRGPRELTGIVDLTRGEDHPTARLSGPGPGKVWHRA